MTYDRYGEPVEDETGQDDTHTCDNGWLGEDYAGRPIPCLTCRPHLQKGYTR
ncbi:hypothetical protein ncot_13240 [Nocardioides sp. JQ2195]|uniref:hypothetical protein n=1 Tax=Nocardioides sp. JQ2195 TaxID=2592334 RepID=UPI00143E5EF5|nr:hypothetical protein [Nocardioides sp. JQ2195]QIX27463.1 hypothetical protein ncot_13240 [Nocardioides sp. JQ2195]